MEEPQRKSLKWPLALIVVSAGGLMALAACYVLYIGVFLFFESVVYGEHPNRMPVGLIRNGYAAVLLAGLAALTPRSLPDWLKASLLTGAAGVAMIALVLHFYMHPVAAVLAAALFAGLCLAVILYKKGTWIYYYALGIAAAAAFYYAWPR